MPERTKATSAADRLRLREAIDLSRACPPSAAAFSVGAVVVDREGEVIATGYSRERDPLDHAEEAALATLAPGDPRLAGGTMYSSLEPCGARASRMRPCAELIVAAGITRVVFALREPSLFVDGRGVETLLHAGVDVVEVPELGASVRAVNAHLLGG